jgi:hypothetical protein
MRELKLNAKDSRTEYLSKRRLLFWGGCAGKQSVKSLLDLTGDTIGLLDTLDTVTSSLDLLLGLSGVLHILLDDLGLK